MPIVRAAAAMTEQRPSETDGMESRIPTSPFLQAIDRCACRFRPLPRHSVELPASQTPVGRRGNRGLQALPCPRGSRVSGQPIEEPAASHSRLEFDPAYNSRRAPVPDIVRLPPEAADNLFHHWHNRAIPDGQAGNDAAK